MIRVATTEGLLALAEAAKGSNREMHTPCGVVDPDGRHLLAFQMHHNGAGELRTQWLVKLTGSSTPHIEWLDFPTPLLKRYTYLVESDAVDEQPLLI